MRYWWANQKTAYDAEVAGGYLWSRKRRANGSRNPFYESVRLTRPGDVIFGYQGGAIRAVGFVLDLAVDAPDPGATPTPPPAPGEREVGPLTGCFPSPCSSSSARSNRRPTWPSCGRYCRPTAPRSRSRAAASRGGA